jgi:hypothetical protein
MKQISNNIFPAINSTVVIETKKKPCLPTGRKKKSCCEKFKKKGKGCCKSCPISWG